MVQEPKFGDRAISTVVIGADISPDTQLAHSTANSLIAALTSSRGISAAPQPFSHGKGQRLHVKLRWAFGKKKQNDDTQ